MIYVQEPHRAEMHIFGNKCLVTFHYDSETVSSDGAPNHKMV